jgi:hypothetical protein
MCNKEFYVDDLDRNRNRRKYCSIDCEDTARNERQREIRKNGKKPPRNVECEICGKIFLTHLSQKVTCSPECKDERHKRIVNANNRARREAILNGTLPKPERKKQKKVETLAERNRKAREMGMTYGEYDKYLRIQAMRKEREQNGRC